MDLSLFDNGWERNLEAATEMALAKVETFLRVELSADYKTLMLTFDGGEGFIGENYMILWPVSDLIQFNEEYEVKKYAPDVFLFGSNGGGEAFGFDLRGGAISILQLPFIGMDMKYAKKVGSSFSDFLFQLSQKVI
jgi:hypothetical protein